MSKHTGPIPSKYVGKGAAFSSAIVDIINGPNGARAIKAAENVTIEITAIIVLLILCGHVPQLTVGKVQLSFPKTQ